MTISSSTRRMSSFLMAGIFTLTAGLNSAGAANKPECRKMVLSGEVNAGQEWKKAIGEGWVFRIVPIDNGKSPLYSGWDLVLDREQPAGFPDALLLATPPYNSINEHEVGTTFGLRAQDAIGWNPRSFRFLTDPAALRESQRLFNVLSKKNNLMEARVASSEEGKAIQRQLKINQGSSPGEFRILDARIAPGVSDAASYAENWALASPRTPHKTEPAVTAKSTPLGELHWIRFSITLWLPGGWKTAPGMASAPEACSN